MKRLNKSMQGREEEMPEGVEREEEMFTIGGEEKEGEMFTN